MTATGWGTAAVAGQARHVPAARHLHQDSGPGGQRLPCHSQAQAGQSGRARGRIPGLLEVVAGSLDPWGSVAHRISLSGDRVRPAGLDQ